MERILIIGCSGAEKSTLSRKLEEKLDIPVIHLDQLWWREVRRFLTELPPTCN